jgi:hypothetical protein
MPNIRNMVHQDQEQSREMSACDSALHALYLLYQFRSKQSKKFEKTSGSWTHHAPYEGELTLSQDAVGHPCAALASKPGVSNKDNFRQTLDEISSKFGGSRASEVARESMGAISEHQIKFRQCRAFLSLFPAPIMKTQCFHEAQQLSEMNHLLQQFTKHHDKCIKQRP